MFGSLLLARTEVRNHPVLRQAMYGYNALVSGLLMLLFLVILNFLVNAMFPMTFEWTRSGFSSLSQDSKNVLESLKSSPPVTVYVLMSQNNPMFNDVRNLLNNCLSVSPADKLKVTYIAPEGDSAEYEDLVQRFPEIRPSLDIEAMHAPFRSQGTRPGAGSRPLAEGSHGQGPPLLHLRPQAAHAAARRRRHHEAELPWRSRTGEGAGLPAAWPEETQGLLPARQR